MACPCHKGGQKLFTTERAPGRLAPVINMAIDEAKFDGATGNMGKSMISWSRFRAIKEKLHHAFHDGTTVDTDPWHQISELVNDYNRNRKQWIVASSTLVFDESMSNFQPRTTKLSLLPFLSFIFGKPRPLGTECP